MEIHIYTGDSERVVRIPSRLALSALTATLAGPALLHNTVSRAVARQIFRELRRYRAAHPGWNLIEVDQNGAPQVRIRL